MAYKKSNLSSGEQIVHVAHKHIIVLLRAAIQWIALFIFALIVAIFISTYNPPPGEASNFITTIRPFVQIITLVAMFISFIAFGVSYLVWQAEQYIITNERVIQVEGVINKKEFTTSLEKINDIETDQTLFGRMLGYGTIRGSINWTTWTSRLSSRKLCSTPRTAITAMPAISLRADRAAMSMMEKTGVHLCRSSAKEAAKASRSPRPPPRRAIPARLLIKTHVVMPRLFRRRVNIPRLPAPTRVPSKEINRPPRSKSPIASLNWPACAIMVSSARLSSRARKTS